MSVQCPACGFTSPDGAKWCEFCKEPFRAKKPPAKAVAPGELPLDPKEIEKKLAADWASPPLSWSPRTRTIAIGVLLGTLFLALTAGILLIFSARTYDGPGKDIPLGKPQVISIPRKE